MILDDHEITNNFDQDMNHWVQDHQALKNAAMKAYWEFQHKHNPDTEEPGESRRYYYSFNFGDVKFFVLDTRSRRSSNRGELIDQDQLNQLKVWLLENKSKLKFIVTSVPFIGQLKNPEKDKWCSPAFSEQRGAILDFLHSNNIEKTTFLTGDMHHSYHASATIGDLDNSIIVHELMSSPINQFTPDTNLNDTFDPKHSFQTANRLNVTCTITPKSFYGNHSSIMAISVSEDKIKYQIYRTKKTGRPERMGSFSV